MNSSEIRDMFLNTYVRKYDHMLMESASLIPSSYDPSILLTTAGMQPFKPYFAGVEQPPHPRLTSCQKVFRTPDIDEVGKTARHLTFFEMLGNFSFGDYFKSGAISMAWDLVTNGLAIDPEKLWVTVHEGDTKLGLSLDDEAKQLWIAAGVDEQRVVPLGEDNFWKAGATGPCGPCSELYYDRGLSWGCGATDCKPGCDCDRYLEFYNLVFMQYSRNDRGELQSLPQQNIDTGMGLERISAMLQNNVSVFDIDSMLPMVNWSSKIAGVEYGHDEKTTKAMRILADHGRSMSFLIADGVLPSNGGRGYVLRRIIRRAVMQADLVGLYKKPQRSITDLHKVVHDEYARYHQTLVQNHDVVHEVISQEEERFLSTLNKGSALFTQSLESMSQSDVAFPGDIAFKLHDTFGFPIEMTRELASEHGVSVDMDGFTSEMSAQKDRARNAGNERSLPVEQAAKFVQTHPKSTFVGYDTSQLVDSASTIIAIKAVTDTQYLVKLASSPFYAEGGGQVSDTGTIVGPNGTGRVVEVLRYEDDQVIVVEVDGELATDDHVTISVDIVKRSSTQQNHTATHLLQAALREVLGDHVRQAGSHVDQHRLRFDFTHGAALTTEELSHVTRLVVGQIKLGAPVTWKELSIDQAKQSGAMMLFGEKYGEIVRMVSVGDGTFSVELCGGTHVHNLSEIRHFIITSESSVGGGTRRIEAITGDNAISYLQHRAEIAGSIAVELGVGVDEVVHKVANVASEVKTLRKQLAAVQSSGAIDEATQAMTKVGDVPVVCYQNDHLSGDELAELSDKLKAQFGSKCVTVLVSSDDEHCKVTLVISVGDQAVEMGLGANLLVKELAPHIGGGGGGRPTLARAGGKNPSGVAKLFESVPNRVQQRVKDKHNNKVSD